MFVYYKLQSISIIINMGTINYNNRESLSNTAIVDEICHSLKQMRLNKNMSQTELSEITGLNRITISRMEAGRAVTLLTLVQVLRALDKLNLLDAFKEEATMVSPIQMLKVQEKQRKNAYRKKRSSNKPQTESEW